MELGNGERDTPLTPFAIMWGGQAVSLLGTRIVRFALVWYITIQTGSATVLAIATIMALLPQVLVAPFAGSYVDRWNRKRTMIIADFLIACSIFALALMFSIGLAELWHIFLIMLIGSTLSAFHWPAMQASTTLMVPRKHLSRVGGMNQALNGMANILAPPLGAVLYALLPMSSILLVDVSSAAIAILAVSAIKIPQPERKVAIEETSVLGDMKEGFIYLKGWRGGFILVIAAMILNLISTPAFALIPILVSNHFLGTENDLAILQSIGAGGLVIGAIVLITWGGTERRIHTAFGSLVLEGIGIFLMGLVQPDGFIYVILFYAIVSFLNPIVNGALIAIFQETIPPEMQGRVLALIVAGASAMSPIGLAFAGPIADFAGVPFWFLVSGIVTTFMAIVAFFIPDLMRIEDRMLASVNTHIELDGEISSVVPEEGNHEIRIYDEYDS